MATAFNSVASEPGAGSRVQVAARGPQDAYVHAPPGSPESTTFIKAWKRATPFSVRHVEVPLEVTPGRRAVAEIPKSGDMLADVYLELRLPGGGTGTWPRNVGYALLRRVRFLVDDAEIHSHERLWLDMYDLMFTRAGHAAGLASMIGRGPLSRATPHVLHVPLRLLTARKGALRSALPLVALPRARVVVDVEFESSFDSAGVRAAVVCDMVDLDDGERRMLLRPTTLLYETVVDSDGLSYRVNSDGSITDVPTIGVDLARVRFPVKLLAWVAYEENGSLFEYLADPVRDVELLFGGQNVVRSRTAGYFELVQGYSHSRVCRRGPPSMYSFSLDASSRQPSGAADLGQVTQPLLRATVRPGGPRFKLKVFALCHNFVEIRSGSARVLFQ